MHVLIITVGYLVGVGFIAAGIYRLGYSNGALHEHEAHIAFEDSVANPQSKLRELRADMARIKKLPESEFAGYGHPDRVGYAIDRRNDAIAKLNADIAYYEELANG